MFLLCDLMVHAAVNHSGIIKVNSFLQISQKSGSKDKGAVGWLGIICYRIIPKTFIYVCMYVYIC